MDRIIIDVDSFAKSHVSDNLLRDIRFRLQEYRSKGIGIVFTSSQFNPADTFGGADIGDNVAETRNLLNAFGYEDTDLLALQPFDSSRGLLLDDKVISPSEFLLTNFEDILYL